MIILKFNELNTSSSPYLTYDDFIGKKVSDYIVDSIDSSKKGTLSIVFRMVSSDKKKFDMNKTVSGEEIKSLSSRKYHSITFCYSIKDDIISYILALTNKVKNASMGANENFYKQINN